MKKLLLILLLLSAIFFFSSCAVIHSLLGIDECNYPDCTRQCADNCNYCTLHCVQYGVPSDFDSNVKKSIDKQIDFYKDK